MVAADAGRSDFWTTTGQDMHLLLIEDEMKLGDYLHKGLTESGFSVDLSRDGAQGLAMALTSSYDAIVLDVMLPGLDGFKVSAPIQI
jgi:two-component system copper resistance phosphate regulon response regulator CusR